MTRFGEHFEARVAQRQQQQAPDLDPVTQARWDQWVNAKIDRQLDDAVDAVLGETKAMIDKAITALRSELIAEIRKKVKV